MFGLILSRILLAVQWGKKGFSYIGKFFAEIWGVIKGFFAVAIGSAQVRLSFMLVSQAWKKAGEKSLDYVTNFGESSTVIVPSSPLGGLLRNILYLTNFEFLVTVILVVLGVFTAKITFSMLSAASDKAVSAAAGVK